MSRNITDIDWEGAYAPVSIVGPTAVGKTAVSIALAQTLNGEIVNADSVQVYRHLNIGAAKPTHFERSLVPFHLLDIADPAQQFTVSDWKAHAETAIHDIQQRRRIPILCGGTGLYIRALLDNWTLAETPSNPEIRNALNLRVQEEGSELLHQELTQCDPTTANRLHPNDAVRIVRALEVYLLTQRPISEYQERNRLENTKRSALRFGLTLPRETLNTRINNRVDQMMAQGFLQEVENLRILGYTQDAPAMRSLGYKELLEYLDNNEDQRDLSATIQLIKQNTRRYAKRQMTWFRADTQLQWVEAEGLTPENLAGFIAERIRNGTTNNGLSPEVRGE